MEALGNPEIILDSSTADEMIKAQVFDDLFSLANSCWYLTHGDKLGTNFVMRPKEGILKPKKTKKRMINSNSKFLMCIICCLQNGLYKKVIRWINNNHEEFIVTLLHNKNPKWDRSYINLFECIERYLSSKKHAKYRLKKTYDNDCKQRFKANMLKLVRGKFLEYLHEVKSDDSCKERRYRFPDKSVLDLFKNNEKMDEVYLHMMNGCEENIHKGLQVPPPTWSPSYQEDESFTVDSPGRAISTYVPEFYPLTWSPSYQEDVMFTVDSTGRVISTNISKVKTVSVTSKMHETPNISQNNSAQISSEFIETRLLHHETALSPGLVPNDMHWTCGVPSPVTMFESDEEKHYSAMNPTLTCMPDIPPGDNAPSDRMSSPLCEEEISYALNSLMEIMDSDPILNDCDPMLSSTISF